MPRERATCVQMNLTVGPRSEVCDGVGELNGAGQCGTLFWLCSRLAVRDLRKPEMVSA